MADVAGPKVVRTSDAETGEGVANLATPFKPDFGFGGAFDA
jgi:hypothetical protein